MKRRQKLKKPTILLTVVLMGCVIVAIFTYVKTRNTAPGNTSQTQSPATFQVEINSLNDLDAAIKNVQDVDSATVNIPELNDVELAL